ncbi:hypothetical protein [Chryseobacterium sp.]|uniref:hypothetical protein n=1 Tax=Chryseobacterium sp. TaxID=1871047 RepID=UPI00289BCE35|nr:hypothetical protein [Chryseobacterium sp.]
MALHSRDVQKLLKAGFFIIREDVQKLAIKRKTADQPDWHILKNGYTSKAGLRRGMNELLLSSKVIED